MKRLRTAGVVLGFIALTVPGLPSVAHADPPPAVPQQASEADAHFREGVALYKEQSFAAALVEFRKAYAVQPDWHVLYNIGITQLELRDAAGALTALDRYMHEASRISDKRKAEVLEQLEKLRGRVGTLRVAVNREGAEITIDDVSVGKSPLPGPVVVNIGPRRVVAMLPSGQKVSRLVDVASRDSVAADLVFAEEAPANVAIAPPPSPLVAPAPFPEAPPPAQRKHDYLWVGIVATGTLAAAGTVTGLLALKAKTNAENDAAEFGTSASSLEDANSQKHTLAGVTDVLFGSALVAAGVTMYFGLRHPAAPTASSTGSALAISLAPSGVSLSAGF
jgi:hypothetical protein